MTGFDTDVLTDISKDVPVVVARTALVPVVEQFVPIVAAEEVLRGQLAAIRQAQAGGGDSLERAYAFFEESLAAIRRFKLLPYSATAHSLFLAWPAAMIRVGTRDLRIAAICIAHGAKLATRNARDYAQVPGLDLEVWN